MSRKLSRLILASAVVAGFSVAPMLGAGAAAGQHRAVDVSDPPTGFDTGTATPHERQIDAGDDVTWYIKQGTHTVTPVDDRHWSPKGSSPDLEANTDHSEYAVLFDTPGRYAYYCKIHGKDAMSGVIVVRDTTPTTAATTPATQPTTTTSTTRPATPAPTTATTAPAPAASAGVHTPTSAAPAPTTTTAAKADKNKKPKDGTTSSSTDTTVPPPAPVDLPDSAIIPALPGSDTTAVQDGAVADAPTSIPEGDAVAVLKNKHRPKGMKLLIATGLGIGALGVGTAGYKFANRSSKYFPA